LGLQFTFTGGTAAGARYRPASARFLIYFTFCKNPLGRLHYSFCPAANAVGLPMALNYDFSNDSAFMGFF